MGLVITGLLLANYYQSLQDGNIEKSSLLQDEIEQKDIWHYLHQIETILNRFKLEPESQTKNTIWRMEKKSAACKGDCSRARPSSPR